MVPRRVRFTAIPKGCACASVVLALFLLPCITSCRAMSRTLHEAELHTSPALARATDLQSLLGPDFRLHHGDHFIVVTDAKPGTAATAAQTLEQVRQDFYEHAASIGLSPAALPDRLICVLFSERSGYEEYLRRVEQDTTDWSSGHYSREANVVALHHDRDNPAIVRIREAAQTQPAEMTPALSAVADLATLHKTRHEAAHQLLYNSGILSRGRAHPLWIDEGLATLFETDPATVNPFRLAIYRRMREEGSLLSVPELVEADLTTIAPEAIGRYYTQAWAFTYFLWNRYPERLAALLEALGWEDAAGDADAAFERHIVVPDDAQIEREFLEFMDGL